MRGYPYWGHYWHDSVMKREETALCLDIVNLKIWWRLTEPQPTFNDHRGGRGDWKPLHILTTQSLQYKAFFFSRWFSIQFISTPPNRVQLPSCGTHGASLHQILSKILSFLSSTILRYYYSVFQVDWFCSSIQWRACWFCFREKWHTKRRYFHCFQSAS